MNDQEVADYLLANPEFFNQHAELLLTVKLADPYRHRAISLQERQLQLLRDQQRQLERTHAELMRYGQENDTIISKINRFTTQLLAEREPQNLPQAVLTGLIDIFGVPQAALRLWQVAKPYADADYAHSVDETVRLFANHLTTPYCGANTGSAAAQWLFDTPKTPTAYTAEGNASPAELETPAASIALIALRHSQYASAEAFGLLVLGSSDLQRFQQTMATDFLVQIGKLVSAALSRLLPALAT